MYEKYTAEERCRKILEDNGGAVADKARLILLRDPALKDLRSPLEFISKNWRDPLTPALMSLSYKAICGRPDKTQKVALALSLMNLSFYIWDDIVDKASLKLFKPTVLGKFGEGTALIVGGLASAKAFSILEETEMDKGKRQAVARLFWSLWAKMAQAETRSLRLRGEEKPSSKQKFWKIKTEAADLEVCLKMGAIMGNGSKSEIRHLGDYGLYLGIMSELWKDFHVSINLTSELVEKIKSGALPYTLLWASERSEKIQRKLDNIATKKIIEQSFLKRFVEDILETRALDNTMKTMLKFAKKGKEELTTLNGTNATQTLQLFIEAQPLLFIESLPTLQT